MGKVGRSRLYSHAGAEFAGTFICFVKITNDAPFWEGIRGRAGREKLTFPQVHLFKIALDGVVGVTDVLVRQVPRTLYDPHTGALLTNSKEWVRC